MGKTYRTKERIYRESPGGTRIFVFDKHEVIPMEQAIALGLTDGNDSGAELQAPDSAEAHDAAGDDTAPAPDDTDPDADSADTSEDDTDPSEDAAGVASPKRVRFPGRGKR